MQNPNSSQVSQNQMLKKQNQRLNKQNAQLMNKIKNLQEKLHSLNLNQNNNKQNNKEQVAPNKSNTQNNTNHTHQHSNGHKCSGHHHHGHGHGHGHNHGHNHNHQQSSEEQNPSQPTNVPLTPPNPKVFLKKIFKTQDQINFRYFRLPLKTIKAWKKDQNIDLTKNKSCMLHLRQMNLNVEQFVKQVWQDVQWINLPECQIDDNGWRILVQNATKSFPDLRVIGIRWNKIKTIKQGDLQHFKQLRLIDLGVQSQQNNPLSEETHEVLKKFRQKYPNVKVQ